MITGLVANNQTKAALCLFTFLFENGSVANANKYMKEERFKWLRKKASQ